MALEIVERGDAYGPPQAGHHGHLDGGPELVMLLASELRHLRDAERDRQRLAASCPLCRFRGYLQRKKRK